MSLLVGEKNKMETSHSSTDRACKKKPARSGTDSAQIGAKTNGVALRGQHNNGTFALEHMGRGNDVDNVEDH